MLDVVDLSNWQSASNITRDYPADAYIFKATEGNHFTDVNMNSFIKQARAAKKPFGLYHFMAGINRGSGKQQAAYFLSKVKPYIGEAILVLDYEMYGRLGVAEAKSFLDHIYKETGVKALMYMSASVTKEENWANVVKAGHKLWVADYTPPLDKVGYWSDAIMWQYTDKPYDKNYFYGDVGDWKALAKAKGEEVKPPVVEVKPPSKGVDFVSTVKLSDTRNLRTGTTTKSSIIATLKKGDVVKLSGVKTSEGYIWGIQNRSNNTKGYITLKATDSIT